MDFQSVRKKDGLEVHPTFHEVSQQDSYRQTPERIFLDSNKQAKRRAKNFFQARLFFDF